MGSERSIVRGERGAAEKKRLKFGKRVLKELFKLLKISSMAATIIFYLLLLFPLKQQRVVSSSCSLIVLIFLPLLLLPIEIKMRKGRSLAHCGSSGEEGVI
ncbi:hypothetical protein ES332_A02G063500v1 [Gossypium tomentosum]|uniref:Uncharacterized protein n=1 Tax=Gossypium tomentosum TaxID=34277 RepID=A0A5D2RET8_GOSTO|nr:hypothetical protein ES332_A02G063500v1 [Gossypium tomentosum]